MIEYPLNNTNNKCLILHPVATYIDFNISNMVLLFYILYHNHKQLFQLGYIFQLHNIVISYWLGSD